MFGIVVLVTLFLPLSAHAAPQGCEAVCTALSAAGEQCMADLGPDQEPCTTLTGKLLDTCALGEEAKPDDCLAICASLVSLDLACDDDKGKDNDVCRAIDDMADDLCAGEEPDAKDEEVEAVGEGEPPPGGEEDPDMGGPDHGKPPDHDDQAKGGPAGEAIVQPEGACGCAAGTSPATASLLLLPLLGLAIRRG